MDKHSKVVMRLTFVLLVVALLQLLTSFFDLRALDPLTKGVVIILFFGFVVWVIKDVGSWDI